MYDAMLNDYMASGQMTTRMASDIYANFDAVMRRGLETIDEPTKQNRLDDALDALMAFSSFINAAATVQTNITTKLSYSILQVKSTVYSLAQKLGANSISISFPFSVGLSWPVP